MESAGPSPPHALPLHCYHAGDQKEQGFMQKMHGFPPQIVQQIPTNSAAQGPSIVTAGRLRLHLIKNYKIRTLMAACQKGSAGR